MKIFAFFISIFLFGHIVSAQQTDLMIVQSLISKYHSNVRVELKSMGLTFVQKKQKTDYNITKYIFVIDGTENNKKIWEIYTEPISKEKVRIARILIKYYYKNSGDITEFDEFIIPEDELINGNAVTYEKSEGKKQAHIDIKSDLISSNIRKQTKYTKILTNSKEKVYVQLQQNYKDTHNNIYFLNISVMDSFSCVGLRDNYIEFSFFDNEGVIINVDGASYHCDFAAVSHFQLNNEYINKLKANPISIIRLKQGDYEYEFFVANSDIIIDLLKELGVK